jgi:hypothetical protein
LGDRLVKVLVKLFVPVPSLVLVRKEIMFGFGTRAQQTPLEVTGLPPSELMVPPQLAEVVVMEVTGEVSIPARVMEVLKFTSIP